jgi:hypothetical protein
VDLAGLGITMNGVACDEHVPEIERYIRTVKERTRCIHTMLPFKMVLARITIEMVYASICKMRITRSRRTIVNQLVNHHWSDSLGTPAQSPRQSLTKQSS